MANMFQIPGNIKQQYLPFVLNPNSALNKNTTSSTTLDKSTGAQYFSFRNRDKSKYKAGFGRLQVCPSSLTNPNFGNFFSKDISFQTLYGELSKKDRTKSPLIMDDIFNSIPGVQIREFLPDTKLDQCINFFGDMMDSVKDLWSSSQDEEKKKKDKDVKEQASSDSPVWFKKVKAILFHAFDYLTGVAKPNNLYIKDGMPKFKGNDNGIYGRQSLDTYLLSFPYTLYYRLQSCVTTNVYELPCKTADDMMYQSNGTLGWVGGSNSIGITNTFLAKIPIVGDILKSILGNVQINFMPWWDAEKGAATPPPEVDIKFDLFNDTDDAAMMNFVFVNTLVPNNRWVQYNMFQHSPNLYDVKIEGYNRLFACAGQFDIKAKGVLRNPPPSWVDRLCSTYGNGGRGGKDSDDGGGNIDVNKLADVIKKNNLIKIPDVYEVSMKFQSLLPSNFNNYLFTYSQNNTMETEYADKSVYQEGAFTTVLKAATTDFIEEMKTYIKDEDRQKRDIKEKEL